MAYDATIHLGSAYSQYAAEQLGKASWGEVTDDDRRKLKIERVKPGPAYVAVWDFPFPEPDATQQSAAWATVEQRQQTAAARKTRIAADKGQGVSVPDLVARLDDLIDELGLS